LLAHYYTSPPASTTCFSIHPTTSSETSPLSLHDALPILPGLLSRRRLPAPCGISTLRQTPAARRSAVPSFEGRPAVFTESRSLRSEEHTSELQSRFDLVCRLLLEKKK